MLTQKSISEKNKQIKSLEAKFDSLNMELCRMKGQLSLCFHVTMLRFEGLAKL